jgi:hypothetical protein
MEMTMTTTQGLVTIFGYGPTGEATAHRLRARPTGSRCPA